MKNNQEHENEKSERASGNGLLQKTIFLIVGLLLLTVVFLFVNGNFVLTLKNPNQEVVLREKTCGDDIISEYNKILSSETIDIDNLMTFSQSLNENQGNSEDPNCLFIIAQGLGFSGQTEASSEAFKKLRELEESSNIYASGSIESLTSLNGLSVIVDPVDVELNREASR